MNATSPDQLSALRAVAAEAADELDRRGVHPDLAERLRGAVDDGDVPTRVRDVEIQVQCPSCQLMGHHPFEHHVFYVDTVPGADGEPIALPAFGDPPDGTPVVTRTCVFCGHQWRRVAG